ncbi:hypothetical protein EON63_16870 [archaeon]|nr:MAG: hypothetical protein EON63_16870 [archaeon]
MYDRAHGKVQHDFFRLDPSQTLHLFGHIEDKVHLRLSLEVLPARRLVWRDRMRGLPSECEGPSASHTPRKETATKKAIYVCKHSEITS